MDYEDSALTSPAVTVHRLPMVHTRLVWIVAFRSAKVALLSRSERRLSRPVNAYSTAEHPLRSACTVERQLRRRQVRLRIIRQRTAILAEQQDRRKE